MKSKLLTLFFLAVGFCGLVHAQPYYPQSAMPFGISRPAQLPGPVVILKQGLKKLMAFAATDRKPDRIQSVAFLEREIVPYFNFAYMARWAAGDRVWRQLDEGQQEELESYIKRDFLTTLAARLTGFGEQQIQVRNPRRVSANEVMVAVSVLNPQAYPARLNFRFYRAEDGWKVFDVAANGSSAVVHYRKQFRQMMRQRMKSRRSYRR
ncbi:MAG: ABC transporter substrate-binding protein [Gammaproteobacteria bacterium]|nr:ABC transporter substrate-binding protein [Gammaproteobacteria bacterium]